MNYCYRPLTANEIKPKGWLRKQLELQAEGLAGQLDRMWPDVRDSKWFGGDREGWERAPYWLDGFMPLAYLLDDADMKARVAKYMDLILQNQQENGWFYPSGTMTAIEKYDSWAQILLGKVLVCYYELSRDERVPNVILRFLRSYYDLLKSGTIKLFAWGEHRWFEFFITLNWAKEQFPDEDFILDMARIFKEQGTDYASLTEKWKKPVNRWTQDTHIVNLCMMLKYEAVSCDLLGEPYLDMAQKLYDVLYDHNGMAAGMFTGDECLSGLSAVQGAELCSVVELMYSFELLYARTGDKKWMERLEKVAFNALPATISDDMWAHQYDQQTNQIYAAPFPGRAIYRTNKREAGVFGLEPEYGCCTANFGQGWPKFAQSVFYRAEDGLVCALALPSECAIEYEGTPVTVSVDTAYPFRNTFT
ncbi:MAG: glycoside hydrolase family 127 protein, partial [Clostridia bacterium]|nr:glycoside hydrolase family 127 protein [Clostridia bacterium]